LVEDVAAGLPSGGLRAERGDGAEYAAQLGQAGGRVGLVVVAALVQPGRRVLRVGGVLLGALAGVCLGGFDDALGVGAAFEGGDPCLLRFFAGPLLRVVQPERTEGVEVVIGGWRRG
jgi:hypothetical protein